MSLFQHKQDISWQKRTIRAAIAVAALAVVGAGVYKTVEIKNTATVSASSYDVNGYIKNHNVKPNTSFDKNLHSFSMFKYSTSDKLPNGVVFHWTANEGSSDTADNEAAYEINGHWQNAFVHTFIDHRHILNIHDTNYGAWGAGPKANARFVQFELCTETSEANFAQSIVNAAYYAAYICYQYGMKPTLGPNGTIWTHHQVTEYLGGTTHVDPDGYLARWNYNTSKFLTLVNQYYNAFTEKSPYGSAISYKQYVDVVKDGYTIWGNLKWTSKRGTTTSYNNQVLYAKYVYGHSNGGRYLSLYNGQNKWLGYVNKNAVKIADGAQGKYIGYGKYVTLTKPGYDIWRSFNWKKSGQSSTTNNKKTYYAKGEYKHFNGSTYLSIYNGSGKWLGYINAKAAIVAKNAGGVGQNVASYVIPTSSKYTIWDNFSLSKKRGSTFDYSGKVLKTKLLYSHVNGSTYYSLYNSANKWIGYVNTRGVKKTSAQGKYIALNKYVTLTKPGYNIWKNFSWSSAFSSSSYLLNRTYLAKGEYKHFNGSTYLSLYNNAGKWQGYINTKAGKLANTAGGASLGYGNTVKIQRKGYAIWRDFTWKKRYGKTSTSYFNQNVYAKYKYNHINGSSYLSIYSSKGGTWLGYINAKVITASELTVSPVTVPSNLYGINTAGLSANQKGFLSNLIAYAIPVAKKYNIYPSIMVMQAAKESAWGTSELVKNANAYFGIKADSTWAGDTYTKVTSEVKNGKSISVSSAFRKYASLGGSVEGYARKVTTSGFYPGLQKSKSASWKTAVKALKVYATASDYVSSITSGINKYRFDLLDNVK